MIHITELIGSDLPIVKEKKAGYFTYDELIYLGEDPSDLKEVAYICINSDDELYEKLYSRD